MSSADSKVDIDSLLGLLGHEVCASMTQLSFFLWGVVEKVYSTTEIEVNEVVRVFVVLSKLPTPLNRLSCFPAAS